MTYPLLTGADDVRAYLHRHGLLAPLGAGVEVHEVTAGNMNRVFLAQGADGGVAVKQAPPWVQVAGPDWPIDPRRIAAEARAYARLADVAPDTVPRILATDLDDYVLVMEDLSDLHVLRDALVSQVLEVAAGRPPADLPLASVAGAVGRFVAALTGATGEDALGPDERRILIEESANPDLCALTVDVVLTEPYAPHPHNSWHPALDGRVAALYRDAEVRDAVASVRTVFDSAEEALLHGDLHTGSVMVGFRDGAPVTKVFDPEFSFVGPIGMDLGLFWANLAIAGVAARAVGAAQLAEQRDAAIGASWASFVDGWSSAWTGTDAALRARLNRIEGDAWRFAGVEAMRRVAGYSHAADLETLPAEAIGTASAEVFDRARTWLVSGRDGGPPLPRLEA
ncbi:MAG: hypothetical protein JWR33_1150 [Naasia sp.]|jgi:5-methylthioribose kinase|uniref:phosphotransferase n=1 Tax=Naasia sp. TaxID=2546198 RepID=UPI00262A4F7F|nr:phosphotransferase [Naasia sp.]MCU1570409.1 hypothetical protein [Naasia sp.]